MIGAKRIRNRRAFTLLEIFICLAIIASLSVIFGFQGKRLLDAQRYESSVKLLRTEMDMAQFLSLAYFADVELQLSQVEGEVTLQRKCDEPGIRTGKGISLPGVADFRYRGKSQKSLVIAKFSSGFCLEYSPIEICDKNGVWKSLEVSCKSQAQPLTTKARSP